MRPEGKPIGWVDLPGDNLPERASTPPPEPLVGLALELATDLNLIGCFDPLDGTPIEAGERAIACLSCGTGYHRSSWEFLALHNRGACCNCRKSSQFTAIAVSASAAAAGARQDHCLTLVQLKDLPCHVGRVVVFRGFVYEHQVSARTGTHFLKFHADPNPFKGFKLVIFAEDAYRWERGGSPPKSFERQTIVVRGLLTDHPTFGLEILPKTPEQVRRLSLDEL